MQTLVDAEHDCGNVQTVNAHTIYVSAVFSHAGWYAQSWHVYINITSSLSPPFHSSSVFADATNVPVCMQAASGQGTSAPSHSGALQENSSFEAAHSRAPAAAPDSATQSAACASFPGFAVLPSRPGIAPKPSGTGQLGSRKSARQSSWMKKTEAPAPQPALSQEPEMRNHLSAGMTPDWEFAKP